MDYYNIHAISHCDWEISPPNTHMGTASKVHFTQVVNAYDLIDVAGEINGTKLWKRYLRKAEVPYTDANASGTLLVLNGYAESVRRWLNLWITDLRISLFNVSGDDTFYDYYPNEVELVGDFVRQVDDEKLTKRFNALIDRILTHENSTYKDDPEETITHHYKI